MMHGEKVRGNSMHFAAGAFSLSSFSFTRHWYAVICVSGLKHIVFVSISLKDEAVCCLKRLLELQLLRRSYYWAFGWSGFVVLGKLLIQNKLLQ